MVAHGYAGERIDPSRVPKPSPHGRSQTAAPAAAPAVKGSPVVVVGVDRHAVGRDDGASERCEARVGNVMFFELIACSSIPDKVIGSRKQGTPSG